MYPGGREREREESVFPSVVENWVRRGRERCVSTVVENWVKEREREIDARRKTFYSGQCFLIVNFGLQLPESPIRTIR